MSEEDRVGLVNALKVSDYYCLIFVIWRDLSEFEIESVCVFTG